MSRIEIEAKVDLERHIVYAEAATVRRPHILPVLRHVKSRGDGADAKTLSADLFPGLEPLSQKLLDICEGERQVVRDRTGRYNLTGDGRDTIGRGKLFVRDAGRMWTFHYANCGFLPEESRVVGLEPADPFEAGYNPAAGEKSLQIRDTPDHIIELEGRTMTDMAGGMRGEFQLHNIHRRGKLPAPRMEMKLLFSLDDGEDSAEFDGETVCVDGKVSVRCAAVAESGEEYGMDLPDRRCSIHLRLGSACAD